MLVAGRGSPRGVLLRAGGAEAAGRGWKRQNSRRHSVVVGSLPGIAAYPVGATRRWALRAGPRKAHEGAHRQRELGQRVHAASSYSESSEGASPVSAETRGEAGPSAASDVEPSNPAAERSEENGGKTSAEAADAAGGKEEEAAGTEETSTALPQFTGRWAWLNAAIAVVAAVWGALKRIVQLLLSPFTGMHDRRAAVSNCMMQAAMHGETDPVPVYHLYHTLNAQRQPQKVVELYEAKKYAVNADVAKEYLRALVLTGQIDKYGLPPEVRAHCLNS